METNGLASEIMKENSKDTTIELIAGQEILDSRGNPTVEVKGFALRAFDVSLRQTLRPKD